MAATLLVALGGGIGAALRHLVNVAALRLFGPWFPWGTLAVNLFGGLAMGLLVGDSRRATSPRAACAMCACSSPPVCSAEFTTFSAFSLDAVALWMRGDQIVAGGYVAASVTGSIASLLAGLALARLFG